MYLARAIGHGGVDTPDYGQGVVLSGFPTIQDMGELAVRLGSPSSYDRYGNVIFIEEFKRGYANWVATTYVDAEDATLTADYTIQGHYAANINCQATDGSKTLLMTRYPFSVKSNVGLELSMNFSSAFYQFTVALVWGDGTDKLSTAIYLRAYDKKLYYLDSVGDITELGDWDYSILGTNYWHSMKLVVDMVNKTYLRCSVDSLDYAMHDIEIYDIGSNVYPYLSVLLTIESDGRLDCDMALDRILLTTNEPL